MQLCWREVRTTACTIILNSRHIAFLLRMCKLSSVERFLLGGRNLLVLHSNWSEAGTTLHPGILNGLPYPYCWLGGDWADLAQITGSGMHLSTRQSLYLLLQYTSSTGRQVLHSCSHIPLLQMNTTGNNTKELVRSNIHANIFLITSNLFGKIYHCVAKIARKQ